MRLYSKGLPLLDFRPPKDTAALIWLAKLLLPLHFEIELKGTRIEIVDNGLERFQELSGKRTVICPNHSNRNDPDVIFSLAKMSGEHFNFLAAREVFDWDHGWNGWRLQHFGCYSVVRGAADRESFKMTKSLIVGGKKKLVIFPEGEISRQNDTLMPLETGVAQMSFWALEEMHKQKIDEPVFLLPVALKYTYRADISHELRNSIDHLEEHLNLPKSTSGSLHERLRAVALAVLAALEQEYDHKPAKDQPINERLASLRAIVLNVISASLQIELPSEHSTLSQVRILRNALDEHIYQDEELASDYQRKLHEEKAKSIRTYYRDLDRVVNFIAIYDGYLTERMTQERFAETIDRFETEVFGKCSIKGPRLVFVKLDEPINLLNFWASYKSNKKATIQQVTDELAQRISTMLTQLDTGRQSVYVD
jgi:1-acyl-sn-glycerol-3-phosphate acyltransferase